MERIRAGIAFASVTGVSGLLAHSNAERVSKTDAALVLATAFQATIFGYPLLGMYQRPNEEVLDPATLRAPFDGYIHWSELATPDASPFPTPNIP